MSENVIARLPPNDSNDWECQCARCGSSMTRQDCWRCGGEGETAPGELYEEDPLWYDEDDSEVCHQCGGTGGWLICLSAYQDDNDDPSDRTSWCDAHPLPGRESQPSMPEWFVVRREETP